MLTIWMSLTGVGGLLRVRALLALGLSGVAGTYLLIHQAMPPGEYNVLWAAAVSFYFGNRGAASLRR